MIRAAPGGPFDSEKALPAEIEANLRAAYHLDEPLVKQFGRYVWNLARGDFGPSFQYKDYTVTELIAAGFPVSLRLGGSAMILALLIGVSAGTIAALRQNSRTDHAVMAVSMTGISIPNFVMAPLLILFFAVYLGWLPAGGIGDGSLKHMILPVISLALPQIAYISRLTRGSMIEVLRSNFVRTARAQGLPERTVILRHALETRAVAGGVLSRPGHRGGDHRLGGDRADLRRAGTRALLRAGRIEPRLHAGDGRGGVLRHADHPVQPAGRPGLRLARSQGEVRMSRQPPLTVPPAAGPGAIPVPVQGRSLWVDAWNVLRRNRAAVVAGALILAMAVLVIVGPWLLALGLCADRLEQCLHRPGLGEPAHLRH
jgi:ABC-type amino acid transport system permease subunit